MSRKFKEAIRRNQAAVQELDKVLRDCLSDLNDSGGVVVTGRFRNGATRRNAPTKLAGRRRQGRQD